MKTLLRIVILFMTIATAVGQTQSTLPQGSKAFSSSIFIAPNADLWTGKTGLYMNLAKKRYVDSLVALEQTKPVSTASLKINQSLPAAGVYRAPVATSNGTELLNGGIVVSESANLAGYPTTIPLRAGGWIQVNDGVQDLHAVNFRQLKNYVNPTYASTNSTVVNSDNSVVDFSDNSQILNSPRSNISYSTQSRIEGVVTGNYVFQNVILNSFDGTIKGDTAYWNTLIGTQGSTIGKKRRNSAIIASSASEITDGATSDGFLKWNSAIVAGYLCKLGGSNSYTLVTGRGNYSNGSAQLVCGRYNVIEPMIGIDNPLRKAFIVGAGRGVDDDEANIVRKNAFYVTHGGRAWVQDELEVDKIGGAVVLKSPDGSRWKITVSDTGQLTTTKL